MAFSESPKIDRSAINSNEGENTLQFYFSLANGFICRPETVDKGADFDVELTTDGNCRNWRFPVQLKSMTKMNITGKGEYISYAFETSRLHYLMERLPAMGLIVLYSVANQTCYYDFTDAIYKRLSEERENDEWRLNESVNIHIPVGNILTKSSIAHVHFTFKTRFERAELMQRSHGEKYDLPSYEPAGEFRYDFNNSHHVKDFLIQYGMLGLQAGELHKIFKLVATLPTLDLYTNKELLLVAAVAYAETARFSISELYCKRLITKFTLSENEDVTLTFLTLKNQFALGSLSTDAYVKGLKEISPESLSIENKITRELNITQFSLTSIPLFTPTPEWILNSIENIFEWIDSMNASFRTRALFSLWNCEVLSRLIVKTHQDLLLKVHAAYRRNESISPKDLNEITAEVQQANEQLEQVVRSVNQAASENNDDVITAQTIAVHVKHYLQVQLMYRSLDIPVNTLEGFEIRLHEKINYAYTCYTLYNAQKMHQEAYDSLCNTLMLIDLCENDYHLTSPLKKEKLFPFKLEMENIFDLLPREV